MITAKFIGGPLNGKMTKMECKSPPSRYDVPGLHPDAKAMLLEEFRPVEMITHVYLLKATSGGVSIYQYRKQKKR